MEKVDIYNNRHEKLNYTKGRKELKTGEYRLSCFAWIINDKDEILIQQRTENAKNAPNMWETVSGGATEGDTSLNGILRELDEELDIQPDIKDLTFIGSYIRYNDFVEVWVLKNNILLEELNLQKEEVQAVKWVTIASYEKMIQEGIAIETAFALFQNYYNQYYGKQLFFKEGTPTICSILK